MRKDIQKIPVDGNFGSVETGPVQLRKDWPGMFISGPDCQELYQTLRYLREGFEGKHKIETMPGILAVLERTIAEGVLDKFNGNKR